MTTLAFPLNPALNEKFIYNNETWVWNGYAWDNFVLSNTSTSAVWSRPDDWLNIGEMPTEGFVGLLGIVNHNVNKIALSAEGSFVVDWGDGSPTESYNTGAIAEHSYDYSIIPDTTVSSRGYKQVIVTVTPQVSGTFTKIDIDKIHSDWSSFYRKTTEILWLDVMAAGPSLINFELAQNNNQIACNNIDRVRIGPNALTNTDYLFNPYEGDSWDGVYRIEMDMANVTSTIDMFYDTANVKSIKLTNTGNIVNASGMFRYCTNLIEASIDSLNSATKIDEMFYYCDNIKNISLPAAPALIDAVNVCYRSRNLETFSIGNTPLMKYAGSFFAECYNLKSVTMPNLSSVQDMNYAFSDCYNLKELNLGPISTLDNLNSLINESPNIRSFEVEGTANITYYTAVFEYTALENLRLPGMKRNITIDISRLDKQAIIQLFNDLGTVTGQTISFINTPGALDLTPTDIQIATNKGWTVSL